MAMVGCASLALLLAACDQQGGTGKRGSPRLSASQVKALEDAAEKGDAVDKYNLARKFREGDMVPLSLTNAAIWFRKAAETGYPKAEYHMGLACQAGEGVAKNPAEAAQWFAKAADQDHSKSQEKLGYAYWKGDGTNKNLVEAYKWLTLASGNGEHKAGKALKKLELAMKPQEVADAKKAAAGFMPRKVYKKNDKDSKPE